MTGSGAPVAVPAEAGLLPVDVLAALLLLLPPAALGGVFDPPPLPQATEKAMRTSAIKTRLAIRTPRGLVAAMLLSLSDPWVWAIKRRRCVLVRGASGFLSWQRRPFGCGAGRRCK